MHTVSDEVAVIFKETKMKRKYSWFSVYLDESKGNIVVMEKGDPTKDNDKMWEGLSAIPHAEPRLIVIDYNNKLHLISKCYDDDTPTKDKMLFATVLTQMKTTFDGVNKNINIREPGHVIISFYIFIFIIHSLTELTLKNSYNQLFSFFKNDFPANKMNGL